MYLQARQRSTSASRLIQLYLDRSNVLFSRFGAENNITAFDGLGIVFYTNYNIYIYTVIQIQRAGKVRERQTDLHKLCATRDKVSVCFVFESDQVSIHMGGDKESNLYTLVESFNKYLIEPHLRRRPTEVYIQLYNDLSQLKIDQYQDRIRPKQIDRSILRDRD